MTLQPSSSQSFHTGHYHNLILYCEKSDVLEYCIPVCNMFDWYPQFTGSEYQQTFITCRYSSRKLSSNNSITFMPVYWGFLHATGLLILHIMYWTIFVYTAFFMQNHVRIFPQTTPMNILFIYIVLVVNFVLWYYPAITLD